MRIITDVCTMSVSPLGLSDIAISGSSTVASGKRYTFTCIAVCTPSCTFAWNYMGNIFQGDQIEIPILPHGGDPTESELLTCEATNTVSQATISATKNLTVSGESGII